MLLHILLLRALLPYLITAAKPSYESAHCRPGGRAFTCVPGDCTSYRSKCGPTTCTSYDMTPPWLVWS